MRFIKVVVLVIVILNLIYVNTFAFSLSDVITGARNFITAAKTAATGADVDSKISGTIRGLATAGLAIGTIVAICAGIVIAIKSMADGAYGKAELKEALTPYIIGVIVLFAAWSIWAAVVQIMENTIQ